QVGRRRNIDTGLAPSHPRADPRVRHVDDAIPKCHTVFGVRNPDTQMEDTRPLGADGILVVPSEVVHSRESVLAPAVAAESDCHLYCFPARAGDSCRLPLAVFTGPDQLSTGEGHSLATGQRVSVDVAPD